MSCTNHAGYDMSWSKGFVLVDDDVTEHFAVKCKETVRYPTVKRKSSSQHLSSCLNSNTVVPISNSVRATQSGLNIEPKHANSWHTKPLQAGTAEILACSQWSFHSALPKGITIRPEKLKHSQSKPHCSNRDQFAGHIQHETANSSGPAQFHIIIDDSEDEIERGKRRAQTNSDEPIIIYDADDENETTFRQNIHVNEFSEASCPDLGSSTGMTKDEIETSSSGYQITDLEQDSKDDSAYIQRHFPSSDNSVIDVDQEEEEAHLSNDFPWEWQGPNQIHPAILRRSTTFPERNPPLCLSHVTLSQLSWEGMQFRLGKVVELKDGTLLRIKDMLSGPDIRLRGHRLQRCRDLNGLLPRKLNELCFVFEIDLDDPRPRLEQSVIEVSLDETKRLRQVNFTNNLFPEASFRSLAASGFKNMVEAENEAPLAVRWQISYVFPTARHRHSNKYTERVLEHLRKPDLVDLQRDRLAADDASLRESFRGKTSLGGAYGGNQSELRRQGRLVTTDGVNVFQDFVAIAVQPWPHSSVIDLTKEGEIKSGIETICLDDDEEIDTIVPRHRLRGSERGTDRLPWNPSLRLSVPTPHISTFKSSVRASQKYTYGDGFCGAGGATRGAVMAGLEPIWGLDFSIASCKTWLNNFPNATMYQMWADQLINLGQDYDGLKVDILHLSFPCQFFSPAHTVDGKDDDMNSATMFSCGPLLDMAKPRVVTLEQTFGILGPKFRSFFNGLINIFTSKGFSIRWKICPLQNWGLPQRRLRLIMIASCPGEILPEFPPFTHGSPAEISENPSLKPYTNVDDVISNIPRNAPNHDLQIMEAKALDRPPWDGSSIAPRCITTHGGQNYHPSGRRNFTNREFAALQGFPLEHEFSSTYVKKQIGNAVPPTIAKIIFEAVREALEKADGIQRPDPDVMIIDD